MMSKRNKRRHWWDPEDPKAHDEIPDGLGIGVQEHRDGDGQLVITLGGNDRLVLGKYARPRWDGRQFYVANRIGLQWFDNPITTYHEELLMAVSQIVDIAEGYYSNGNPDLHY